MTKKAELVLIPSSGVGHVVTMVEMAKLLVHCDHCLSITVLSCSSPSTPKSPSTFTHFLSLHSTRTSKSFNSQNSNLSPSKSSSRISFMDLFAKSHKPLFKAVTKLIQTESASGDSPRLAGFVLDMFCTNMIEVANDFGVPSYIFSTSNQPITKLEDSATELIVPNLVKPFPLRNFPVVLMEKEWTTVMFQQAKGIIVNTFTVLESYAAKSFSDCKLTNTPPVYTPGPVADPGFLWRAGLRNSRVIIDKIDRGSGGSVSITEIKEWLDDQPPASVVFLCPKSTGSFGEDQVKEIACALENRRHRFLWSLRQPPPKGQKQAVPSSRDSAMGFPGSDFCMLTWPYVSLVFFRHNSNTTYYANLMDVLPEGFIDRMTKIVKVIGWAPQNSILAHKAIGGFVSHCGWNSVLESVWFGVPIPAWPMYAEQQFNAFEMVMELESSAKEGIKKLMEGDSEIRKRMAEMSAKSREAVMEGWIFLLFVWLLIASLAAWSWIRKLMENDRNKLNEMSEKSGKAMMEGGSSFTSLGCFIDNVMSNLSQNYEKNYSCTRFDIGIL
ncbi:LOW QUALITY PROTEIN: anthocyanidin 3-O-glucosyltransferase 2-like [Pistacia vera]|uniref:LOW QUALITY PROTEIN: anthocyanidin 3-O-glucosyltransferase 2-like n=1 Tax=Pistacia vera TaxID=55513 RepID=UPI0012634348|nr:LOW QUALITY PROTEIN: anthocyanidin 3-O-glucosyltransferase 2-like [Pistacia vera]